MHSSCCEVDLTPVPPARRLEGDGVGLVADPRQFLVTTRSGKKRQPDAEASTRGRSQPDGHDAAKQTRAGTPVLPEPYAR